jgi:TolA-binding protein
LAQPQQRPKAEPPVGRLAVIAAAVIGAGAILGYGFAQVQARKESRAAQEPEAKGVEAPPPRADVVDQSQQARVALDTAALAELEPKLAAAAPTRPDARHEQLAALTALAVESSVRGAVTGDAKASEQASGYVTRARAIVDAHEAELDPGHVLAARARLALASGHDVLEAHPAVLLPGFHDHELQLLLASEPLWRAGAEPLEAPARAAVAQALEQLPSPTALERLVLALALPDPGAQAQAIVRDVLAKVPAQPLAKAVEERLRSHARVAVADPPPSEPQPAEPEPSEPQPKKPSTPKPPKPKAPPTNLAEEGCKLVQSGKAEQGFSMLQKAFDQDPHDNKVVLCMAEGHMKLGRLPSARAMVERVLRGSSKNKKALLLAAKIEDKLGNDRSAADYYRKVLELEPDNATAKAYVEKSGG